jgi:anthranilate phosphoribosyltransferase
MDGAATPAQVAALLVALRMKGETVEELVGAARAMRARMLRVTTDLAVVDTCGTGGDGLDTFNISTAAALVAAGAGARVAKHGNRAASGRVGGADVLEALGVRVDLPPEGVRRCLERAGIGFCFAPRYHAAMRFAAAPRRQIGVRTFLNLLGPLTNPAGAESQLIGVFAPEWTEPVAWTLARLGTRRALVVHAADGLDEISATGPTQVSEVAGGTVRTYHLTPEDFGVTTGEAPRPRDAAPTSATEAAPSRARGAGALRVGDAAASAAVIREVLGGARGPAREVVLVNAAAVLVVAGLSPEWRAGYGRAAAAIDGGAAADALARLVAASNDDVESAAS